MSTLTEEQRIQWATDGYLQLKGILSPVEVKFFLNEVDALRKKPGWEPRDDLPMGHYGWVQQTPNQDLEGFMDRRDILPYHQTFIELMDRSYVFDLIVDIMGPYILHSMAQAIVRPPSEFKGYTHTDGGQRPYDVFASQKRVVP